MKMTAGMLAVLFALGLAMAGCSGKDESAEGTQGMMEGAGGDTNHAADGNQGSAADQGSDAGMMSGGDAAAPAEPAPTEGQ